MRFGAQFKSLPEHGLEAGWSDNPFASPPRPLLRFRAKAYFFQSPCHALAGAGTANAVNNGALAHALAGAGTAIAVNNGALAHVPGALAPQML